MKDDILTYEEQVHVRHLINCGRVDDLLKFLGELSPHLKNLDLRAEKFYQKFYEKKHIVKRYKRIEWGGQTFDVEVV